MVPVVLSAPFEARLFDLSPLFQDLFMVAGMALVRGDVIERAVVVARVVPLDEAGHPRLCFFQAGEPFRIIGSRFHGGEQRLNLSVIVRCSWPAEQLGDAVSPKELLCSA